MCQACAAARRSEGRPAGLSGGTVRHHGGEGCVGHCKVRGDHADAGAAGVRRGVWHVEGICASCIAYLASDNITESRLHFRSMVTDSDYDQNGAEGLLQPLHARRARSPSHSDAMHYATRFMKSYVQCAFFLGSGASLDSVPKAASGGSGCFARSGAREWAPPVFSFVHVNSARTEPLQSMHVYHKQPSLWRTIVQIMTA